MPEQISGKIPEIGTRLREAHSLLHTWINDGTARQHQQFTIVTASMTVTEADSQTKTDPSSLPKMKNYYK